MHCVESDSSPLQETGYQRLRQRTILAQVSSSGFCTSMSCLAQPDRLSGPVLCIEAQNGGKACGTSYPAPPLSLEDFVHAQRLASSMLFFPVCCRRLSLVKTTWRCLQRMTASEAPSMQSSRPRSTLRRSCSSGGRLSCEPRGLAPGASGQSDALTRTASPSQTMLKVRQLECVLRPLKGCPVR